MSTNSAVDDNAAPALLDTWDSDSAATSLDPSGLPVAKVHKAWERHPQSPFARDGRYRKVWKRYETRSSSQKQEATDADESAEEEYGQDYAQQAKSPGRVVKRLRVKRPSGQHAENADSEDEQGAVAAKPTRWDRRKSGLPSAYGLRHA